MVKVLLFYPMHPVNINTEPPQDTQGMAQKELSDAVVWCVHRSRITRSIFVLFILVLSLEHSLTWILGTGKALHQTARHRKILPLPLTTTTLGIVTQLKAR